MRPFTTLAIALAVAAAGPAFADQRSHAPAAHHEARSEGGAAHAPAGQAVHAIENKASESKAATGEDKAKPAEVSHEMRPTLHGNVIGPSSAVEAQAVDVTDDLVKLSEESRNYKASSTAVSTVKDMMDTLLRID